jgi:hypothetical protein
VLRGLSARMEHPPARHVLLGRIVTHRRAIVKHVKVARIPIVMDERAVHRVPRVTFRRIRDRRVVIYVR